MKERKEVGINHLITDDSAWIDLLLSKTALILATLIILAAVYSLAGSSADLVRKDELEIIATEIASNIDSAGSSRSDNSVNCITFDPESYEQQLSKRNELNISVSGEYIFCTLTENGRDISAARQLSYRTLPLSPNKFRNLLSGTFGADGNSSQPINSAFPYADVTDFLADRGTGELYLNTSKELHIQKTTVFVTDGSEVNGLEYILVYQ
ncbi:hypothetical protein SAMN04488589_1492 [Methanolobus vulcani]|jgi:hypothetical protein|uniref:Uncharacterized protein n=1 Tax=Methanolobus vulcani TaxID=38026 RepID=A0A7Z7FCQ8_9EURY|nr:hypothetical protein [Methanolobus vulcani]SDF84270.1 hypothetical protein SAMN04488589_1492 [Methanolobus vulcani]